MKKYLIVGFIIISCKLFSQPIITDRPDQTESSSTIMKGSFQIESGIVVEYTESSFKSERNILLPTSLFRFGVTKQVELRFVGQTQQVKRNYLETKSIGMTDSEIGTKIQIFRKEGVNIEVAFLSHIVIPSGSSFLTNNVFESVNKLSIAHNLSENISIGYNIGYNYHKLQDDYTYSIAFGLRINDKVGIYLEPYGELQNRKKLKSNFDGGLTYLVKDNVQLDFSMGAGLNHTMNYTSIGISWNISKNE